MLKINRHMQSLVLRIRISYLYVAVTQTPDGNHPREERLISAKDLAGKALCGQTVHILADQETETGQK